MAEYTPEMLGVSILPAIEGTPTPLERSRLNEATKAAVRICEQVRSEAPKWPRRSGFFGCFSLGRGLWRYFSSFAAPKGRMHSRPFQNGRVDPDTDPPFSWSEPLRWRVDSGKLPEGTLTRTERVWGPAKARFFSCDYCSRT